MDVTILLADSAQTDSAGKVHALGLGWTVTSTPTPPMAVVLLLDVGWDETNRDIQLSLDLLDGDGRPVTFSGPFGEQPLSIQATTQAGRPPGLLRGSQVRIPLAVGVGEGIQLTPNQRYEWRAVLDGDTKNTWSAAFSTMPSQSP